MASKQAPAYPGLNRMPHSTLVGFTAEQTKLSYCWYRYVAGRMWDPEDPPFNRMAEAWGRRLVNGGVRILHWRLLPGLFFKFETREKKKWGRRAPLWLAL
ncbi:Uu.00g142360.m01.CDS01 [Anthostomella pinea]|uniref:Uu.00g142360.m01.CDS01 n=1 Tax=Anthostomella pinea TaxID=933095 RepID=A0AAI8VQI4_9PEZI|nr:Uu.00g142360.m01.CDS01 [Anthostomella pinea]